MLRRILKQCFFLALVLTRVGPALSADRLGIQPMDLFGLDQATDAQISPDGGVVAYVRIANDIMTDEGRSSIWLVDTRTGSQSPIRGVGADTSQPRWSADGRRLAFVAKPNGDEEGIYIYSQYTSGVLRIASLPHSVSALSWSRDGRRLAFIMTAPAPAEKMGGALPKPAGATWAEPLKITSRVMYHRDGKGDLEPGYDHVFVVSADGGEARQVTFGDFKDGGPISWSPDGNSLLFTGRRGENWERENFRSAIFSVSVKSGVLTQLTWQAGPDTSASFSPDGKLIAYTGYDDTRRRSYENRHVYIMDQDGRDVRTFGSELDRSLDHPRWSKDQRSIYAGYDDHGISKVARLKLTGGLSIVAEGLGGEGLDLPYTGGDFSVAENGVIAFSQAAPNHPPDVAIAHNGQTTRLTNLNETLLNQRKLGETRPVMVRSSLDNAPVDAWLVTPPNFDPSIKWPMILEIHGGPFLSYGPVFSTDDQLYAAAGYVVLYVNPRGSTSYGEAFANGIDRNFPGPDYDDLISAVSAACAQAFIDPNRLFVTGGSGGGTLTAWIVGKTDRFKAAAAQRPAINWTSLVLTSDSGVKIGTNWIGKTPWQDPEGYWKHSPLSLMDHVKTPTLVVVGERDVRTPLAESEQLYGALKLRGVPSALIRVPGAFHEMAERPSHSAAKAEAILDWFARYDSKPR
jgi:dipeptidyl aminopeptidase/acylaminoacyl peptidase